MAVHYGPQNPPVYTFNGADYYLAIDEGTSGYGGTVGGDATEANGDYLSLTTNVNSQSGYIEYSGIFPGSRMYTTFDTYAGGGTGADAIWFWWGATSRPSSEDDTNHGGYLFAMDEYAGNKNFLDWDGTRLHTENVSDVDDGNWHSWTIEWNGSSSWAIKVWKDGSYVFGRNDSERTLTNPSTIGWGGRTGGSNNHHRVRNMKFYVSTDDGTI